MNEQPASTDKKEQKPRHRSPNYPGIGLRAAVGKIEALYRADGLAPSPKSAALKHMGYERLHSEAARTLSALKSFGLIEEINERIKLSQRGIEIVARPKGDQRRDEALRNAAISPEIYQKLLEEYRTCGLPSDASLKSDLITVRKFNPSAVDGFVQDFRDTLDFADLSNAPMVESEDKADHGVPPATTPKVGDYVQWESGGQIQFESRRVRGLSEDRLWAFVDGDNTGFVVKELTIVNPQLSDAKPLEQALPPDLRSAKPEKPTPSLAAPKMRSYSWALSGDFTAKMELFGEATTEEDIDALKEYVDFTIKALKRSLRAEKAMS